MRFSPTLFAYRLVWEPALWIAHALNGLEKAAGGNLWPARWRLADRLAGNRRGATRSPSASCVVWMHAASLGECKGLWAVAEGLAKRDASGAFILTANTVEGLEFLQGRIAESGSAWQTRLAPLDHPRVIRRFLRAHSVRALVLFEIELWPHYVLEARRAGLKTLWISALATRTASRARAVLPHLDWIQAQTAEDARALNLLGARETEAGADLRGLHYLTSLSASHEAAASFLPWESRAGIALVSMHADEIPEVVRAIEKLGMRAAIPVFVFPRKRKEWPRFRDALAPLGFVLQSQDPAARWQIVDAFGKVTETLARCRVAVIGGSYAPHRGHNLWEPLGAGMHTATGPHHEGQRTLADNLEAAGLLKVSPEIPDLEALHALPDPGPAVQAFAKSEKARLQAALAGVAARLIVS